MTSTHLVYRCAACGKPVAQGAGYVHVSREAIHEYQEHKRTWPEFKSRRVFVATRPMPNQVICHY